MLEIETMVSSGGRCCAAVTEKKKKKRKGRRRRKQFLLLLRVARGMKTGIEWLTNLINVYFFLALGSRVQARRKVTILKCKFRRYVNPAGAVRSFVATAAVRCRRRRRRRGSRRK
jgi:hypothetical protein